MAFRLVKYEFYYSDEPQEDDKGWVFQVVEVVHSLVLPSEVFASATDVEKR